MSPPTVLLFDIDGTLLTCGGAGRAAMERAFEALVGSRAVCDFSFGGNTDRGIARQGFLNAGREASEDEIDQLVERYLAALAEELPKSENYRVFPGVEDLLGALTPSAGLAIGIGTGNVEEGARAKLRQGGLDTHFAFGGFGCDHELRTKLVEAGATRGASRLGVPRGDCRVVVIGDTPRDVSAARAIGAECLVVKTGWSAIEDLEATEPDRLVNDLTDASALAFLLGR
ncbi:MAG: HAD family hydrolase [Sandaracinaceae bacterium]